MDVHSRSQNELTLYSSVWRWLQLAIYYCQIKEYRNAEYGAKYKLYPSSILSGKAYVYSLAI